MDELKIRITLLEEQIANHQNQIELIFEGLKASNELHIESANNIKKVGGILETIIDVWAGRKSKETK